MAGANFIWMGRTDEIRRASTNSNPGSGQKPFRYCPYCGRALQTAADCNRTRLACATCGWIHYLNPAPGVVVLIAPEEHVLLGRRAPGNYRAGLWCLPGGFIEFDEDFLAAAIRETREETGLEVEIGSILGVASNFHTPGLHTLVVVLLAAGFRGQPRPGDDLDALAWYPLRGPLPEMAFAAERRIIERFGAERFAGAPIDPYFLRPPRSYRPSSQTCSDT